MEACWAHNPEVRGSKPRSAKEQFFEKANFFKVEQMYKMALAWLYSVKGPVLAFRLYNNRVKHEKESLGKHQFRFRPCRLYHSGVRHEKGVIWAS